MRPVARTKTVFVPFSSQSQNSGDPLSAEARLEPPHISIDSQTAKNCWIKACANKPADTFMHNYDIIRTTELPFGLVPWPSVGDELQTMDGS